MAEEKKKKIPDKPLLDRDAERTASVTVRMTQAEWQALKIKADAEFRTVPDQASLLMRKVLVSEGIIAVPEVRTGRD